MSTRSESAAMLKREAQVVKLVDTRDLKSLGLNIRAGSTPALGTNKQLLAAFVVFGLCKITSTPPSKFSILCLHLHSATQKQKKATLRPPSCFSSQKPFR